MINLVGNVWDTIDPRTDALAHGCNSRGVMGAGFAKQVRNRYPACYAAYNAACVRFPVELGNVLPWVDPDTNLVIYNLITQLEPAPPAELDAIARSMTIALDDARTRGLTRMVIPHIGAGLGQLNWLHVQRAITLAETTVPGIPVVAVSFDGLPS